MGDAPLAGLPGWAIELLRAQRVARLATVGAGGQPLALPVVFALDEAAGRALVPLDGKPKTVGPRELRRVRDIEANPRVALVADRYDEDWSQLAWVQLRGDASILEPSAGAPYDRGVALLADRYPQYAAVPLAGLPLIDIKITAVRCWRP